MIVTVTLGPGYSRKYRVASMADVAALVRSVFGRDATLRPERGGKVAVVRPFGEHGEGVVGRLRIAA